MIVTCGEALIDMVPITVPKQVAGFQPLVGGALFNTAVGLGRLGIPTAMVAGISNDMFGEQLVQALLASQVSTEYLVRSNLPTTLAFIKLTHGQASYTFYDENSASRSLLIDDIPRLPNSVSSLLFGGISLISEPAAETYCQLAEHYSPTKIIMLDPNIRPAFINNEKAYRQRLQRLLAVADIVKVSDEDLDWLVPGGADVAEKVLRLRQLANELLIVTRGAQSTLAFGRGGMLVEMAVHSVPIVDTVGAGDTYNSGLLASLMSQGCLSKTGMAELHIAQVERALVYAGKVAAVTVSRAGANPPWAEEIA
ncbi:MAG: carbohydrate kinase [Gammaproteobacteria bacterium]|nr:carbohydrate kinase [Gammaproteobacteria bacterium]MCP4880905.1 carbohydrate kinase [Gammaproteobacteria bacterium]MDP6164523.1 carbohydrate kinase [Gammaproteobacteria bacterium]